MNNILFLKRVFSNKIYWISVIAAILLLLCSNVYTSSDTGEGYTFISMFYDKVAMEALEYGQISMKDILLGYDRGYLWMFCPIIVGIPCVIINKTERFVLFRSSKNKYIFSKYFSNILASGCIVLIAYIIFGITGMVLVKENMWDINFTKKLLSVFCWGILNAIPCVVISEFLENKYLILCIPFVLNYFVSTFLGRIIPYNIYQYISPYNYQITFLYGKKMIITCSAILLILIVICAALKKILLERRCDCGQK